MRRRFAAVLNNAYLTLVLSNHDHEMKEVTINMVELNQLYIQLRRKREENSPTCEEPVKIFLNRKRGASGFMSLRKRQRKIKNLGSIENEDPENEDPKT